MAYSYNRKCANAVRVWRTDCHIPAAWRETPAKENLFRQGIQVEFNALADKPTPYAAWVYVSDERSLYVWVEGDPWRVVPCASSQEVATYLLPPVDAIPLEIAGLGEGWGLFSDQLIEVANKLACVTYQ